MKDNDKSFPANWSVTVRPDNQVNSPSTLLIPASLMPFLDNELFKRDLQTFLILLLNQYRGVTLCRLLPVADKCKCLYQDKGQDLQRVDFRPTNKSWLELGQLARAFGISRCLLFVYLLMMYMGLMVQETVGVPTDKEARFDLMHPEYIQYQDRLHLFPCKYERKLSTEPHGLDKKLRFLPWFQ